MQSLSVSIECQVGGPYCMWGPCVSCRPVGINICKPSLSSRTVKVVTLWCCCCFVSAAGFKKRSASSLTNCVSPHYRLCLSVSIYLSV